MTCGSIVIEAISNAAVLQFCSGDGSQFNVCPETARVGAWAPERTDRSDSEFRRSACSKPLYISFSMNNQITTRSYIRNTLCTFSSLIVLGGDILHLPVGPLSVKAWVVQSAKYSAPTATKGLVVPSDLPVQVEYFNHKSVSLGEKDGVMMCHGNLSVEEDGLKEPRLLVRANDVFW